MARRLLRIDTLMTADTLRSHRYSKVAMGIHWITALLVIVMIPMGIWMSNAISDPSQQAAAYRLYQLHKSIGFLILALTVVRILWRVKRRPPPSAPSLKPWEHFLARATHAAFYAILLLMPLSGWIYVSSGWAVSTDQSLKVATSFFGWFEIPHIAPVAHADSLVRRTIAFRSMGFHWAMAIGAIVLIVLHVAGALKHQFLDRDGSLGLMVPRLTAPKGGHGPQRRGPVFPALIGVIVIVAAASVSAMLGLTHNPGKPSASAAPSQALTGGSPVIASISTAVEPGTAPQWAVVNGATLTFSGVHAGAPFKGGFRRWKPHIYFDPQNLPGSKLVILIETSSVFTGDATQEGTLVEEEWFNVGQQPVARFDSTNIQSAGGDRYDISGTLRVKDRHVPVTFKARIQINGTHAEATGKFSLDRTALDLGMASDPAAEWVSRIIPMTFRIEADRR